MATVQELAQWMEREIWDTTRVLKNFRRELDERKEDDEEIWTGEGTDSQVLKGEYQRMWFLVDTVITSDDFTSIRTIWRALRRWADEYNGIPDTRFDAQIASAPVARLTQMMATTNELTQTQYESGFNNENFSSTGTIWRKFYDFVDRLEEMFILMHGRFGWYPDEWAAQGSGDRATEALILMDELTGISAGARSEVVARALSVADYTGQGPRKNILRRHYIRRQPDITGGIYLLERGTVPAGGPVPAEYDPDIDTVGTYPALTNGPA